jgi:ABC-type phosphate/phosphonate transport system substrate-binding protein
MEKPVPLCHLPGGRRGAAIIGILLGVSNPTVLTYASEGSARPHVLRIGTGGSLKADRDSGTEKGALKALQDLIKEETGVENEIVREESWRPLAEKMAKRQLAIGIFHGYEFAWAKERYAELKPLVLATNGRLYQVVHIAARRDNPATDFAGLQDQSLCLPDTGQRTPRLFLERACEAHGKKPEAFFSKITSHDNIEDAVDDVIDGRVQAVVLDQTALDAYRRRKPGRFDRLKLVARSQPLPPIVIACYDTVIDRALLRRVRDRLLFPPDRKKEQAVLTLFGLTEFTGVPKDFDRVLAETRKAYPDISGARLQPASPPE